MSELVDAYRAARPPADAGDGDGSGAEPPSLESTLAALWERGRSAHPELGLDGGAFAAHLARCDALSAGTPDAVHAEDLFVACAALGGSAAAVETLRSRHRPTVSAYLRVIETAGASIDEVEQRLWEGLLVAGVGKPAKLARYSGRGPLSSFLGIAAQRIALDSLRHQSVEQRAAAGLAAEIGAVARDAELELIKARYRDGFEQAVRDALEQLEDRERMLLRLHVVDGLTFDRIAKVYGVTQPTVSRWMASAREHVLAETRRLLRTTLSLSEAEFESLSSLLVSQLDVSVSRILRRTH
jgi:RNA polymerase sigma-70 factor (ECF subfamily)